MQLNPYESPLQPAESRVEPTPWWVQGLQFCSLAVATSMTLGALANTLNGSILPEYFVIVMGWDPKSNSIWLRAILQGILEGFVIGLVLSVAFFGIGSLLTGFRLTFARSARYLAAIALAAVCSAVLAGFVLMSINGVLVDINAVHGTREFNQRFGWVSGCISGLEQGGALAAFIALIVLVVRDWRPFRKHDP